MLNKSWLVLLMFLQNIGFAQTIGSLAELKHALPVHSPVSVGADLSSGSLASNVVRDSAKTENSSELKLIGLFLSKKQSQAKFSRGSEYIFFGIGDVMQGGWQITHIEENSVSAINCSIKRKKCMQKLFVFDGK